MMKTNLYAYDDILFKDIHNGKDPDYIYANPTIYDIENNYMVVINEENSQLELIDSSSGLLKSIHVCNDMELISHIENILEFYIKNKENEAKAAAFDRIVEQRKKTGVITLGHHAWKIIKEYESGEYDD